MDKKVERIIKIYSCLLEGKVIKKSEEAERLGVNQRTIQRDLDDIRTYFANDMTLNRQLIYDWNKRGYVLVGNEERPLTSQDILILCKVFLGSKPLVKSEMLSMVDRLVKCCVPKDEQKKINTLIANEKFHYTGAKHDRPLSGMLWDIAEAIYSCKLIRLVYQSGKREKECAEVIEPAGIMFEKESFYLTAYRSLEIDGKQRENDVKNPQVNTTIYRMDNIIDYEILEEHFHVPYKNRFEEGEFGKKVNLEIATEWG